MCGLSLTVCDSSSNGQPREDGAGLDVADKVRLPETHCTRCGHIGYNITLANQQCGRRPDGKNRCKGLTASAINVGDCEVCAACAATGYVGDRRCERCSGHGWQYVRDLPEHMR
jgi:hypothetical protein